MEPKSDSDRRYGILSRVPKLVQRRTHLATTALLSPKSSRTRPHLRARSRTAATATNKPDWQGLASVITSVTAIGALIFTALSLQSTRDQVATAQAQSKIAEQGHFTDRFTKAVEQLDRSGPSHLQARLGGIYALERLAHDSPRDQPTIVEGLSAFVRTNTPTPDDLDETIVACPHDVVSPDVQAALDVLGRRDAGRDGDSVVRLRKTCLQTAELRDADLRSAVFDRANLGHSNLINADMADAYAYGAGFNGADLTSARLVDANLTGADLRGARLRGADLSGTNLTGANLTGADLRGADLSGATFRQATLFDAVHDDSTIVDDIRTDAHTRGHWWDVS